MSQVAVRKFGTAPVFLTAISTILCAIMFLRFGYAVAHMGLLGLFTIIMLGHLVMLGLRHELLKHTGTSLFLGYDGVGDILFVPAASQRILATDEEIQDLVPPASDREPQASESDAPADVATQNPSTYGGDSSTAAVGQT